MASIAKRPDGRWRARYRDADDKEHARHFDRKTDAQRWLDEQTASMVGGTWVTPKTARMTTGEWLATWLDGYRTRRPSTVRQAEVHIKLISEAFGTMPLANIRPSHVRSWTARLADEGRAPSYVYALHARLGQVLSDAVHDGILPRSPVSRRTSPGMGSQRPYVATTEQVWALYDVFPVHLRGAVLLSAFAGLRVAEACALRVTDVDWLQGVIRPARQYPDAPLKSETSRTPIPIPRDMVEALAEQVAVFRSEWVLTSEIGRQAAPWTIERAVRDARAKVPGLPSSFRYHDGRHYLASMLIAAGADVKVVQARLRHASAKTTLDTYGHLWPDSDDSTRAAISAVFAARADYVRTERGG